MRAIAVILFCTGLLTVASFSSAQPPEPPPGKGKGAKGGKGGPGGPGGPGGRTSTVEEMVARMMTFDKNNDGKLTKQEVSDGRLSALFERADANKDGIVTKEELTALFTKEAATLNRGPGGFGGPGGPGGFGPPPLGQLFPPFVLDQLNLTDAQKKELESLQRAVDAKLDKILTEDQRKQFKEMRGPGGPGGPGGRGGFGGPGGNPPPPQE